MLAIERMKAVFIARPRRATAQASLPGGGLFFGWLVWLVRRK